MPRLREMANQILGKFTSTMTSLDEGNPQTQQTNMAERSGGQVGKEIRSHDDSSDSENEAEPAKSFHRRMSTNREIKTTVGGLKDVFQRLKIFCRFVRYFATIPRDYQN